MSERHSDHDGSDIFWPGYVDAVTNLVLNLLFLLTIMTVAVFMFALELGRASKLVPPTPPVASVKKDPAIVSKATTDPVKENIALKLEIHRLNMQLAKRIAQPGQAVKAEQSEKIVRPEQPVHPGGLLKTVDATARAPKPLKGLDEALASDAEALVRFRDEAIALTPAEREDVREALQPIVASGKASIYVEVPAGFSEAKRLGYYRAMDVRNLLIEMGMPSKNIEVKQAEGKNDANASIVRVR